MATLEEIGRALKNAHAAGDTAAAQKLAAAYKAEQAKAPAPRMQSNAGMVEQGTISRDEYMRTRGGVGFNGQPLAPQDYGTAPAAPPMTFVDEGTLGLQKGMRKGDIERFDPASLDRPMDTGARTKMPRSQSLALGVTDIGYPVARQLGNLAIDVADAVPGVNLEGVKLPSAEGNLRPAITQSLQDNPNTTRFGQGVGLAAGGGAQLYNVAVKTAPKLVAPAVAARFAGDQLWKQGVRYGGRGLALGGAGAADYFAYNALAEAPNQARLQGEAPPSLGQRIDFAAGEVFTPGGAIAAGIPIVGSALGRGIRGAFAAGSNRLATGSATLSPVAGQAPRQVNVSDLFTPRDVQGRVTMGGINASTRARSGRTAREEALDLLIKKGFDADEAEKAVKLLSYDNYSTVDEMLFEVSNADIDQLTVALGRVGGDAQKTLRTALEQRAADMPDRIRVALRDAMGLSGDDLEDFAGQLAARADDATANGYAAAYGQQVSDDTWTKMWDRLRVSPDAADAISAGARLAKNSYRGDPAQLAAAGQLDELAGALRSPDVTPPKLSTHALDYLDRGFGSLIGNAKRNNPAFASSLIEIRDALRNSGLDADTGLNFPRNTYSQFKAAGRALDYGAKAFGRSVPLRDLKKQFANSLKDSDEVFEDIVGEGRSVVDQALIMGWLRGAEDAVETSTNPGALIRQIYGSERQRAKLLEMMPEPSEGMTSGYKGDLTKNIKALVGSQGKTDYKFGVTLGSGARAEGKTQVPSLFDRQRQMLGSQNRVSLNSQTGNVTEAITAQGGGQRTAQMIARAVMNPQQAAQNAALWAIQRVTTPAIFKPAINRELGDILSTRGRDKMLSVIDEIRQRQLARSGGAPLSGPPAGGGTATSGFAPALRTDLGNAAGGALGGGIMPIPSTGDPQEDMRNRIGAVLGGAALGFGARRFVGGGVSARGQGMGAPKTPQQAMRAELPGSPEYEAAVAKGLDMSTPARMARAKEMGFDTDTVLYHGTATDVASFDPRKAGGVTKARSAKLGTWLTGSPKTAEGYADFASGKPVQDLIDASYAAERAGQWDKASRLMAEAEALETAGTAGQTIMPLHVRGKLKTIDMDGVQYDPDDVNLTEIAKTAKREGFDGVRLTNFSDEAGYGQYNPTTHVLVFDPANIRSVHAAFDPDKAASPILTAGLGGGGKRPRKDSPEAILAGVQKITAQLKATGTQAATPRQPEMRIGRGLAKAAGITDNRELGAKAARDMLAAGRSPAEIFTATNHVPMTVDGNTIMVRAAGKSPDEVTAAFWQEMAKPVSRRAEWIREQTRGIKPIGPDAIARQPLETRAQVVTSMIRKGEPIKPQAIWEETDMVVIMRGRDGQPVVSKYSVPDGSEPVSLMDGANFKSFDDVIEYLETVQKLPRAEQPAWYRENFSDPLTLARPASRLQRAGDFAQRRQNTVGATLVGGAALGGTAGVLTAKDTPASMRIKLDEPPQRQNRR